MRAAQLVDPAAPLAEQNARLMKIAEALMARAEQSTAAHGLAYAQFERAALLEAQVRQRTTDLEHALGRLRATTGHLSEAVEAFSEGFALFDAADHLVLSNSRFCKHLTDITPAIQPGLAFADFVKLVSRSIYLDLPKGETQAGWRAQRMAQHARDDITFNVGLTRDRWLQVSEHRTAAGGTVILQTDVTEIMRAERAARDRLVDEQAQMLRATLDHLNQGVVIFDRERRLVGWNTGLERLLARPMSGPLLGLRARHLLDRLDDQIRYTGDVDKAALLDWMRSDTARPALTFEVAQHSGACLSVFAQEMPDRGVVMSFTDITTERTAARALRELNETLERRVDERTNELGAALDEARRANASKTRFVAAASHDLLQPLSAAKLFVSFLSERAEDDLSRDTAAKAVSALASVEGIIEALLDISKLDSGQASMAAQDVALGDILASLGSELAPAAEAKGLDLRVQASSHIVASDPVFLRRILQNLVTNAIRYTETGRIVVGARRVGDGTRIEVHDTGPGIAACDRQTIFQEFRQLQPSHSGSKGLGLGLTIVERACAMLGHRLDLRTEPGRGSCFSVTVPRVAVARPTPARPHAPAGEARPLSRDLVVMLVENDPELASALTLMIEDWGSHVVLAESGEQALGLLDEIDIVPDRLLIDYQLGEGMTGADLARRLVARHGPLPARLISASRNDEIEAAAARAGVALLQKPIDRAALIRLIDETAPPAA